MAKFRCRLIWVVLVGWFIAVIHTGGFCLTRGKGGRRLFGNWRFYMTRMASRTWITGLATVATALGMVSVVVGEDVPTPQSAIVSATVPAATPAPKSHPTLAWATQEVLKLSRAKVGEETILAYINRATTSFDLTADDMVYLKEQGVTDRVLNSMLAQRPIATPSVNQQPTPAPAPAGGNQQVLTAPGVPQAPTVVYQQTPTVVYQQAPPTVIETSPTYVYSEPYYNSYGYYPYYGYYGWGYPGVRLSVGFGYYGGYRGGYYHGGYHGGGYHGGGGFHGGGHGGHR